MEKAGPITMHLHFKVLAILLISVAAVLMVGGCTTVPAGHVGIVVNNMGKERGVQSYTAKTGFFLYNPISTQVFVYPTSVQTVVWTRDTNEGKPIDESITFGTIEQIRVSADVSLSFQLFQDKVPNFYVQFRNDDISGFIHGYLHNVARNAMTNTAATMTLEELNGAKKSEFMTKVDSVINYTVQDYGVVTQIGFTGALRMDTSIIAAINRKQQAKQDAETAVNLLAKTTADANRLIAQKEGEAIANNKVSASITPTLIEWKRLEIADKLAERWDGKQPEYLSTAAGGSNLLMQLPIPR
jgi:regulator of protease activity HflC (stomatin/prohibitin superfamily)